MEKILRNDQIIYLHSVKYNPIDPPDNVLANSNYERRYYNLCNWFASDSVEIWIKILEDLLVLFGSQREIYYCLDNSNFL